MSRLLYREFINITPCCLSHSSSTRLFSRHPGVLSSPDLPVHPKLLSSPPLSFVKHKFYVCLDLMSPSFTSPYLPPHSLYYSPLTTFQSSLSEAFRMNTRIYSSHLTLQDSDRFLVYLFPDLSPKIVVNNKIFVISGNFITVYFIYMDMSTFLLSPLPNERGLPTTCDTHIQT